MTAYGYYSYFRNHGKASTTGGRPGDLVVYGGGSHIGIYLGNGYVISTLTSGVRIHGLYAVTAKFTAFLHTGMSTTTTATTLTATAPVTSIRYTTTYVNLRKGPSTAYAVIKVMATGTRLGILSSSRDSLGRIWYKAQLSTGTTGWVAGWYTRAA
jgi:SH3-like domain-containing protein